MSLAEVASQSGGFESLVALLGLILLTLIVDRAFLRLALNEEGTEPCPFSFSIP